MQYMFYECRSLTYIDLSNFNNSYLGVTSFMFYGCELLTSINLSNFDTSYVFNFEGMFYNCYSLTSLNLTYFNTKEARICSGMFDGCKNITVLDLSSFVTTKVNYMDRIFSGCSKLTSIDISNFRTGRVKHMYEMFYGCELLTSIDLSNFDTSKVNDMEAMFAHNPNLKYINLKNMVLNQEKKITGLIDKNLINPIICINDEESLNKVISLLECPFVYCSDNWGEYINKILDDNNKCIEGCILSKYDGINSADSNCYEICSYYFYFDEKLNKYLCTEEKECPIQYHKLIFEKNECVKSCGNTLDNQYEFNNICLSRCPDNFKCLEDNSLSCSPECPKKEPFLYLDKLKYTDICSINERQKKICITNYFPSKDDNLNIFDLILDQTRFELYNNFDPRVVNGEPIEENGVSIIITKINGENNDNIINLGECEERLKDFF